MRKVAALAAVLVSLAAPSLAHADPLRYGIGDDWPLSHPCGDVFWQSAADIGYQDIRLTVKWDEATPTVIPYQANLLHAIDCAASAGVQPILAVYPLHPGAIGNDHDRQSAFADFVGLVVKTFPTVRNIIVGNEPNVNRFWQPQFRNGVDAAAKDFTDTLFQAYAAAHVANQNIRVWGPAISSRGNDNPSAMSNPSQSPVRFIRDMGDAFYEMFTDQPGLLPHPLFDEFDMHPYPPTQDTDPFSKPFQWPQAGAANLDRIKQALWDAFHGTPQPVPAEQLGGAITFGGMIRQFAGVGLPINLDEAGEQTVVTGHDAAYTAGPENVKAIDPVVQWARHAELAEIAACDPDVKSVFYFPLIDEPSLSGGFQSGNLYADLARKASYDGMKQKIASAQGQCQGGVVGVPQAWMHTTEVVGAGAIFGGPGESVGSDQPDHPTGTRSVTISATANEDANYTATLYKVASQVGDGVPKVAAKKAATAEGVVRAYFKPAITIEAESLQDGFYQVVLTLTVATSTGGPSGRSSTFTSHVFKVGNAQSNVTVISSPLRMSGSVSGVFMPPAGGFVLKPGSTTMPQLLMNLVHLLGTPHQNGIINLNLLWGGSAGDRQPQSARPKLPVYKIPFHKGKKIVFPTIKKLPAGRYAMRLTISAANGAHAVLTTPAFTVDKTGKLSFGKATTRESTSKLSLNGSVKGVFTMPAAGFVINLGSTTTPRLLTNLAGRLGTPHQNGVVNLAFLVNTPGSQATQSASAKLPIYKVPFHRGKKIVFPEIKKLPAGRYAIRLTISAANGAHAVLTTPIFTVYKTGKLSFGKAKPAKKP